MRTLREPVPWDDLTVVKNYLRPTDSVVDLRPEAARDSWSCGAMLPICSVLIPMER